jgi:hypothetical protein
VEEVIASHPQVQEVCVGRVPDEQQGEAVKAWVVLKPGAQVDVETLRAFCKEKLSGYKVPRHIEFRQTLPKNMVAALAGFWEAANLLQVDSNSNHNYRLETEHTAKCKFIGHVPIRMHPVGAFVNVRTFKSITFRGRAVLNFII